MENKVIEIYEITIGRITVTVKIDYIMNKISLVDSINHGEAFSPKHYVFAERGVEYMNDWLNIINAMSSAVIDAKRKYEHNLAEVTKFKNKKSRDLAIGLMEAENKQKKNVKRNNKGK
jgi:fructose-1,6-bisphosphatase/sedoheptulose 1,7-bisphosphatase-like protein